MYYTLGGNGCVFVNLLEHTKMQNVSQEQLGIKLHNLKILKYWRITVANLFSKARSRLLLDNPFFGTLALKLIPKEDPRFPTGYTNGKVLGYNPKWFEKLSNQQQVGFIAHEIMHIVYMHMTRREQRHAKKWNVAGDYVINNNLVSSNKKFIFFEGIL